MIRERLERHAHRKARRSTLRRWNAAGGDTVLRFDYALNTRSVVLDLGGYEGQWASDLYARHRCRVLVFEPVAAFARNIRERFANNPDIDVFDYGLGAATSTETIHVRGANSSTYRSKGSEEKIRLVDVAEWFDEHGIECVDLMKVNIEGGEFNLLERLIETRLVAKIRDLQVQFHRIASDSDHRMAEIQRALAASHEPTYQYRYIWENWSLKPGEEDSAK